MNTFRLGQNIKLRRKKKGMTRREFLAAFNKGQDDKLHEMTLYKYERGLLRIPPKLVGRFARALGVKVEELESGSEAEGPLRIGVQQYPDSDFLAFAARDLHHYSPDQPPLGVEIVSVEKSGDLLDCLAHRNGASPLDAALFNESEFNRVRESYAKEIVDVGNLVRFSGYSLLYAPPGSRLISFREKFNHGNIISGRQTRLELALWQTLVQLTNGGDDKVAPAPSGLLYPAGSDRESLLRCLVEIARNQVRTDADQRAFFALQRLLDLGTQDDEEKCFDAFLDHIENGEAKPPVVFVGNLAQRLVAEECGASVLMTQEDLKTLAGIQPKRAHILQPMNCLLVNRQTYEDRFDQILTLHHRWNEAANLVKSRPNDRQLHSFLNKSIVTALERIERRRNGRDGGTGDSTPEEKRSGSPFFSVATALSDTALELVRRIYAEQMIDLLPWDRPREVDPEDEES